MNMKAIEPSFQCPELRVGHHHSCFNDKSGVFVAQSIAWCNDVLVAQGNFKINQHSLWTLEYQQHKVGRLSPTTTARMEAVAYTGIIIIIVIFAHLHGDNGN